MAKPEVGDEFVNKKFDKLTDEIVKDLKGLESEELGRFIMPMLASAVEGGRTRHIKMRACEVTILALRELSGRKDCGIKVMRLDKESGKAVEEEGTNGMEEAISEIQRMIDGMKQEEQKVADAKPVSKAFENITLDQILNAKPIEGLPNN
jgi:hypothetical protein